MQQAAHIVSTLKREADAISASYVRLPLPIGRICYEQGINVQRSSALSPYKAHLRLPELPDGWADVTLPTRLNSSRLVTDYDRFCLAHELGHLIIHRRFGVIPSSKQDYWIHEKFCDYFTRVLLLPDGHLPREMKLELIGQSIETIAFHARMPFMQVAKRLIDHFDFGLLLRVKHAAGETSVASSSHPNGKLVNKLIVGILRMRLCKFMDNGNDNNMTSLSGLTLSQSGITTCHPSKEYITSFHKSRERGIICIHILDLNKACSTSQPLFETA